MLLDLARRQSTVSALHLRPQRRVYFDELTTYHTADSNLKNKDTPPEAYEAGLSGDDTLYEVSMLVLSVNCVQFCCSTCHTFFQVL